MLTTMLFFSLPFFAQTLHASAAADGVDESGHHLRRAPAQSDRGQRRHQADSQTALTRAGLRASAAEVCGLRFTSS